MCYESFLFKFENILKTSNESWKSLIWTKNLKFMITIVDN
jgi:hypothetical protein